MRRHGRHEVAIATIAAQNEARQMRERFENECYAALVFTSALLIGLVVLFIK